jgi:cytochrome c-type biogenesis protein CcmH
MRVISALLCIVALGLPVTTLSREALPLADDPVVEARLMAISEELRCLVCQNETLASSHAELADDLRRELRAQIKRGKTDTEILKFMVDRYGDFVRYRPPLKTTTVVLWFGPFALLLGASLALIAYLRRRALMPSVPALTADEKKRAATLLGEAKNRGKEKT